MKASTRVVGTEVFTVDRGGDVVVPAGVRHAFAAGPEVPVDVFITLVPGVERFDYFRLLPEVLRGTLPDVEVARLHEQYDVHFVDSPEWNAAS